MKRTLLTFLLILNISFCISQTTTNHYTIEALNENVGTLTATKTVQGDKTTYVTNSSSTVHIFGTTTVTTSLTVIFRNGVMESSTYTSEKNGNSYDSCIITEINGVYTVNRKGKKSTFTTPVKHVTIQLYFEEPGANDSYFDPLGAAFYPVELSSPDTYTYDDPASKVNTTYVYKNGQLQQGTTDYTLYKYSFTRKE